MQAQSQPWHRAFGVEARLCRGTSGESGAVSRDVQDCAKTSCAQESTSCDSVLKLATLEVTPASGTDSSEPNSPSTCARSPRPQSTCRHPRRRAGAQGPDFLGHRPLLAHQHREHGIFMSFWAFAGFSVDRVVKDRRACRQIRGVRKVSSEFALGLCFRCFQAVKRHASCTFPAPSDTQVVAAAGTLLVDHPLYLYENVKNLKTHNCRVILRGLHLGQQTTSLKSANDRTRPALVNANPVPMGTGESR